MNEQGSATFRKLLVSAHIAGSPNYKVLYKVESSLHLLGHILRGFLMTQVY